MCLRGGPKRLTLVFTYPPWKHPLNAHGNIIRGESRVPRLKITWEGLPWEWGLCVHTLYPLLIALLFSSHLRCKESLDIHKVLRWFRLVLHCASLLRTIFESLARANERARVQNVRNFPKTKLDSEINARFLLNEHGDPHFLVYKINENNILINWEKNWQKCMATFLANEINATDRDVTGPTEQVQIMFPLKDKNIN